MIEIDSNFNFKLPTAENRADLIGNGAGINGCGARQARRNGPGNARRVLPKFGKNGNWQARPFTAR
jgi:hypothetical protein